MRRLAVAVACVSLGCASIQAPPRVEPHHVLLVIPDQDGDGRPDNLVISSVGHGDGGWVENAVRNCRTTYVNSITVIAGGTNTDRLILGPLAWCSQDRPKRIGVARNNLTGESFFFLEDDRMHPFEGVRITDEEWATIVRPQLGGAK